MFEEIKERLLEYVDFPAEQITPDTAFIRDLNMNSFDIITLLGELEEAYNVAFEQEDLADILNIRDLIGYIEEHAEQ